MFFFSFLLRCTCYPAFCYVSELVTFPCTARDRDWEKLSLQWTRNRWKWHLFYKGNRKSLEHVHCSSKTSVDSFRRPQVIAGRESENQVRKWKGPSPFVLIEWWFFFYQFHSFHQTWISFERFSYALKPSAIICFICFGQAWLLSH